MGGLVLVYYIFENEGKEREGRRVTDRFGAFGRHR